MQLILTHRRTGEPLEGVKATFFSQEYNRSKRRSEWIELGTETSDANGFLNTSNIKSRSFRIRFDYKGDRLFLDDQLSNYRSTSQRRPQQITHFFTDRMIYRPGQTIHFKALLLERDAEQMPRILPNEEVEIVLRDVNWQEVRRSGAEAMSTVPFPVPLPLLEPGCWA